ncbi:hypothetical protein [Achromobacter denitrificans]|uniref:Uncharacterized protein n=1 Tax=Achromobacter denitrificans TaxID=32002 RepID=A0A6N0JUX0_ACHDE|nr:hypothetical protein [Achromobacter denitrificans]MDF3851388.1 hypothetical protein [Achromobacter denitrificans]MDF3940743.1 hypothetical protein [Achromobacter denitrificans]QKQ51039.1 hypothetical protein FOC81_31685 [Achromobacter denitrificans]
MNTFSASAPPARIRPLAVIAGASRKLGALIAPRDHAGKGNWSHDADIPWYAWPGALAFAAFFLFGPQILGWLVRLIV